MDAEDLAELGGSALRATDEYADRTPDDDPFARLLAPEQSSSTGIRAAAPRKGQQLLQRMGWKPGHGIGPLVSHARREQLVALVQRLQSNQAQRAAPSLEARKHTFPPPDTPVPEGKENADRYGLGFSGAAGLHERLTQYRAQNTERPTLGTTGLDSDDEDHVYGSGPPLRSGDVRHVRSRPPRAAPVDPAQNTGSAASKASWADGRPLPRNFVVGAQPEGTDKWYACKRARLPLTLRYKPEAPPADWTPDPRRVWAGAADSQSARPEQAADVCLFMHPH